MVLVRHENKQKDLPDSQTASRTEQGVLFVAVSGCNIYVDV